jgi:hypothetical protein
MRTVRAWEVYRTGWDHPERVKAVSSEEACDVVSRLYAIPRNELRAHLGEPREGGGEMTQVNVCYCGGAEIRRDEMYSLGVFSERTGLMPGVIAEARNAGLRVWFLHDMTFVCGGDWIDYCTQTATVAPIPDAGPTPADMRGEVEHGP